MCGGLRCDRLVPKEGPKQVSDGSGERDDAKSGIQLDWPVYRGNRVPGTPETGNMDRT